MEEVIHVHVFDPRGSIFGKKSDKAEIHTYTCEKASVCDAHKKGMCIKVGNPLGQRCFGRKLVTTGPTPRARSFGEFIAKGKAHEKYRALKAHPNKIFKVGDGYMMPYPHINLREDSPFESKSGLFMSGHPFLENATPEAISAIYTQRPYAMMGGEIKSYQEKVVPEIVKHMHDEYPELYRSLLDRHPDAASMVEDFDCTGKKALLATLLPGEMTISKNKWFWDGETLVGDGGSIIFPPTDATEVRVIPKEGATVRVTNTDMVSPDTKFID